MNYTELYYVSIDIHFISFHLFADNIAIHKADTVILGCRSPQGNNLFLAEFHTIPATCLYYAALPCLSQSDRLPDYARSAKSVFRKPVTRNVKTALKCWVWALSVYLGLLLSYQ